MRQSIALLDWVVIGIYLAFLIIFAIWLSRSQDSREDYYVGGRAIGAWPVAISIMATQCSTNSILGAPAFVAFTVGGGLMWLQYELAVPLAMIGLLLFVMPLFRHMRLVSVYEYLEHRFDLKTRLTLSGLFLFVRSFATAVTVYSIALVIDLITGLGFFWSVVLLGLFTVIYDVFGGIRGVIYSDVLQLLILVAVLVLLAFYLTNDSGGLTALFDGFDSSRRQALDFRHHGLGDGQTFAFWPMLFGGLFLYLSYYGCDQSQVQRQLSTKNIDTTNVALLINGFLRFPLVALYCFVGVGIAVYAGTHANFINALPATNGAPDYNLAVPLYMISNLPVGLAGLGLVALFAAAMSSLDSVLNSLSATTMEDFVRRFHRGQWTTHKELIYSRVITAIWGLVTLAMAFYVGDIASTVLEAINKIGSLANGPILAVFALGFLTRRANGSGAVAGLLLGILFNGACWLFWPGLSWLWWNVTGFVITYCCGLAVSRIATMPHEIPVLEAGTLQSSIKEYLAKESDVNWYRQSLWLCLWFLLLLALLGFLTWS